MLKKYGKKKENIQHSTKKKQKLKKNSTFNKNHAITELNPNDVVPQYFTNINIYKNIF